MSFDLANSGQEREDRKYYDRNKGDEMQISRTDMNMLIMNYLVTGNIYYFKILLICVSLLSNRHRS